MPVIHKYQIETKSEMQEVAFPCGAEFLHVGLQNNVITIWVAVDEENAPVTYDFWVRPTGGHTPTDEEGDDVESRHIGTVQAEYGLVWHVFVYEEDELC